MRNKGNIYIASIVFWLLIWQLAAALIAKPLLLPSPIEVIARTLELVQTGAFWGAIFISLSKILVGFFLAMFFGAAFAAISARYVVGKAFFALPMRVMSATPVASFIILALLWLKTGALPAFTAFLMVLPLIYNSVLGAVETADKKMLEAARVFKFTKRQIVAYIYAPAVAPAFLASVKTGIAFAWKAGVAAEVLATPRGSIGAFLYNSKIYLETTELFAWTAVIIILSILLERLILGLTKIALSKANLSEIEEVAI